MKTITLSVTERNELFTKYVTPYFRLIYWISMKYSCRRFYIDDNYQEVLAELCQCIHTYDPERGHIKSWICTVAKYVVLEKNRKHTKALMEDCDLSLIADGSCYQDLEASSVDGDPDDYRLLYSDAVLEALEQLSPINRETLFLHLDGYKLREIAEIVHKSGGLKWAKTYTIGSRLYQAKQQMRRMLDKEGTF